MNTRLLQLALTTTACGLTTASCSDDLRDAKTIAVCVDEGNGDNWGVDPETNEGCLIDDSQSVCLDEGNGDNWGVDPVSNAGCWIDALGPMCIDDGDGDDWGINPETNAACLLDVESNLVCEDYASPPMQGEVPPTLLDPDAPPIPGPDPSDPFGAAFEFDTEEPVSGAGPTQPKYLRVDIVSNNWSEINWAASHDDGEVVGYQIHRSDGFVFEIGSDITVPSESSQKELDKFFSTTSFIDCNYTRFSNLLYNCAENGPNPGEVYSYTVTARDDEGLLSAHSEPVTVRYLLDAAAPVPLYDDFYLGDEDEFAQCNDLSRVDYFIDEFDLMFWDDFDGEAVDASKWNTRLTWGDSQIINGEQQYFVDTQSGGAIDYDPFSFTGQSLVIEAIVTPPETKPLLPAVCQQPNESGTERCLFLSGVLASHDKFGFTYGYTESRMKVSGTAGALSSFYLFHRYQGNGADHHAPEIDIVEYLGENPYGTEDAFQSYHYDDVIHYQTHSAPTMSVPAATGESFADEFHTFGVLWEPQLIIWYIDGVEVKRLTGPLVSRRQMNIITYLVAGSGWAPTPDLNDPSIFPIRYELDYIRSYQRGSYRANASYGP